MATHAEVAERYANRGIWKEGKEPRYLKGSKIHVSHDGKWIFSYGEHFPMAFYNGKNKTYIVNGDTFSSTTSRHQRDLRDALKGKNSIIVPFSTLRLARIHPEDISVVEYNGEHSEWRCLSPACRITEWQEEIGGSIQNQDHYKAHHEPTPGHNQFSTEKPFYEWRHLLGQITFKVSQRFENQLNGWNYSDWIAPFYNPRVKSNSYWLGGIDETARGFGGGYFLSRLRRKVTSIEDAYESLKPVPVVEALLNVLDVKRQGDIFGIPVTEPWGGKKPEKITPANKNWDDVWRGSREFVHYKNGYRPQLLGTNHYAREAVEFKGGLYARGMLYHIPGGREADHRQIKLGEIWHLIERNTAIESFAPMSNGRGRID